MSQRVPVCEHICSDPRRSSISTSCEDKMFTSTMCEITSLSLRSKCTLTIRFTNIFITSVLLISVISPTIAAPRPYLISQSVSHHNHNPVRSICSNPCGVNEHTPQGRHKRFPNPLKEVKLQLNTTLTKYQHLKNTIMFEIYNSTMNLKFKDPSLPDKLAPVKQMHHFLQKLYGGLCLYCEAFEKLSSMVPHSDSSSSFENRTIILRDLKQNLRALVCEVENSINISNIALPHISETVLTKVGTNWPKHPDRTAILTMDMSTYFLYNTYLEAAMRDLKMKKNRTKKMNKAGPTKTMNRPRPTTMKNRRKLSKKRNAKPRKINRVERS